MSNIEEDVIDVIAFLAFHQSISNSFQKEKQITANKLQQITINCVIRKSAILYISIY